MNHLKYILDGVTSYSITERTADEVAAALPGVTGVVVQATPFLEPTATTALARVNEWRVQNEAGGFAHAGKSWQSDQLSAQRIIGAAIAAQIDGAFSQSWTAADNSVLTLDRTGMLGLFTALGQHVAATFAAASTAKAAIRAATSIEQINDALATLGVNQGGQP
jgi:Domain of unknown function (DUF4376)